MSARILVVDDIPANVRLLEAKLAAEYFEVVSASSGKEALELIEDDQVGAHVLGLDVSQHVVDTVNEGRVHIEEVDLHGLVQGVVDRGRLRASITPEPADSFHHDQHPNLRADYVLANPPFNTKDWGAARLQDDPRWRFGVPPAQNANFAWVQHIVHHLAPTGTAGVVLANGSMSSPPLRAALIAGCWRMPMVVPHTRFDASSSRLANADSSPLRVNASFNMRRAAAPACSAPRGRSM